MTMNLTAMPRVGEIIDGLTVGALMIDQQTGQSYALLVSQARPDDELEWDAANTWAASLGDGFRLPSRPEGATLHANNERLGEAAFEPEWHWLNEQHRRRAPVVDGVPPAPEKPSKTRREQQGGQSGDEAHRRRRGRARQSPARGE